MEKVYKIIDLEKNKCVNAVVWDGIAPWTPPVNSVPIQNDQIQIKDEAHVVNGKYELKKKFKAEDAINE